MSRETQLEILYRLRSGRSRGQSGIILAVRPDGTLVDRTEVLELEETERTRGGRPVQGRHYVANINVTATGGATTDKSGDRNVYLTVNPDRTLDCYKADRRAKPIQLTEVTPRQAQKAIDDMFASKALIYQV